MDTPNRRRLSRKRLLAVPILLAGLLLAGVLFRTQLERVWIAATIRHQQIFHEPAALAAQGWWARNKEAAGFYWDVSKLRVDREARLRRFNPELRPLVKEIARRQAAREGMQYSMHIYREIRWLLNFTSDTADTRIRISDLRESLRDTADQRRAAMQLPEDGSWGLGINTWYLRLYYTVDEGLDGLKTAPVYRLSLLDRLNSPGRLRALLDSDLYDRFGQTGVFNREELDETFSAVARLLHRREPVGYVFDPGLEPALRRFVQDWQNPETGCWGQWMVDREGKVWKMDDMAMTFHVVSDFRGKVDHLDRIAKRILELDNINFPAGIKFDGDFSNHLNWDVVKIFRYAWPLMDSVTRRAARRELSAMLHWCLSKSYQPGGSFATSELDDTYGDACFYGVAFLVDAGYFDARRRFWTNEDLGGAEAVRGQLLMKFSATDLDDPQLKAAYDLLVNGN